MGASEQATLLPLMMAVMKSSFAGTFLLLHLSSTVSGLGPVVFRYYSYFNYHYTWHDAQIYCRNSYGKRDLATIHSQSDMDQVDMTRYNAWIGLHKDVEDWTWLDGEKLDFYAWGTYEPGWDEQCGFVTYPEKELHNTVCETVFFFICNNSEFISEPKNWDDAKAYCKHKHLATFKNFIDIDSRVNEEDFPIWIGLHRDGKIWKWSSGVSKYRNWSSGEPSSSSDCASISSVSKEMATRDCSTQLPFICYEDNLVLIEENKTWEEALEHCRALSFDLVSVQPEDYNILMDVVREANAEEVWIGLRFLAGEWLWVNGADMMYSDLPLCPPMVQHCGVLTKTGTGSMETRDCSERKHFLCYIK